MDVFMYTCLEVGDWLTIRLGFIISELVTNVAMSSPNFIVRREALEQKLLL